MTDPAVDNDPAPTILDVAALARVSHQSVSRVINGQTVRPDTRRRVLLAIKRLSYQPQLAARDLARGIRRQAVVLQIAEFSTLDKLAAAIRENEERGLVVTVSVAVSQGELP